MKKIFLFLMVMQGVCIQMHAQTHLGTNAGTLGANHSYFGSYAGNASTNSSPYNSFFGTSSGRNTESGNYNTAMGSRVFYHNTEGDYNTAIGGQALYTNTSGNFNVALGRQSSYNISSDGNTVSGYRALYGTTLGLSNVATGSLTMYEISFGYRNVATGFRSLNSLDSGAFNVSTGAFAMEPFVKGHGNCAFGVRSLSIAEGLQNSAFGFNAFYSGNSNCVGSYNTAFGASAGFAPEASCNVDNTTALGYNAKVTASNQVRIGNSAVTSIGGQVMWSALSDGRFKKDLKKDVLGLAFVNQLNPVSYTVDKDAFDSFLGISDSIRLEHADVRKITQRRIGFVAQEIDAVLKKSEFAFSGLEIPQNEQDFYAIRYAEFVVPLVKAVQELSGMADERQKEIATLTELLRTYLEDTLALERANPALFENASSQSLNHADISIELPKEAREVSFLIYNKAGQQLKEIQIHERGRTTVKISASEFSPGIYLYALISDGEVVATNQVVMK